MTSVPHYDASDINARLDGCELFERRTGLQGKRVKGGRQYSNPFQAQRTGSFTVYHTTGFKDYATGDHGPDTLSLIAYLERLDRHSQFPQILEIGAREAGLSSGYTPSAPLPRPATRPAPVNELPRDDWQTAIRAILPDAQAALWSPDGLAALVYIRQRIDAGRGYPDAQIDGLIRAMGLGFLGQNRDTGLRNEEGRLIRVWAGLLMPYTDATGEVTALQVRPAKAAKLDPAKKYLFVSGSKPTAYPFVAGGNFDSSAPTVITESVIKAAAVKLEYPEYNCLGLGSATYSLTPDMLDQVRRCPAVYLMMDNDPDPDTGRNPGQAAQERLAAQIGGSNVRLCLIPFGKDPDGFIKEGGQLTDLFSAATVYTAPVLPTAAIPARWADGLPDVWAAALAHSQRPNVGVTVWLFVEAARRGLIGTACTLAELIEAGRKLGVVKQDQDAPIMYQKGVAAALEAGIFTKVTPYISNETLPLERESDGDTFELAPLTQLIDQVQSGVEKSLTIIYADPKYQRFTRLDAQWFEGLADDPTTAAAEVQAELTDRLPPDELIDTATICTRFIRSLWVAHRSTPIDLNWPITTAAEFREARLRGFAQAGGQRSNLWLAAFFIGVSITGLKNIRQRAGIKREEVKPTVKLDPGQNINTQVLQAAATYNARPLSIEVERADGRTIRAAWSPTFELATVAPGTALRAVALTLQAPSKEKIVSNERKERPAPKARPALTPDELAAQGVNSSTPPHAPAAPADELFTVNTSDPVASPDAAPVKRRDTTAERRQAWVRAQIIGQMIAVHYATRSGSIISPDGEIVARAAQLQDLETSDLVAIARGRSALPLTPDELAAIASDDQPLPADGLFTVNSSELGSFNPGAAYTAAAFAERAALKAGKVPGQGRADYLATLTPAQRAALQAWEDDVDRDLEAAPLLGTVRRPVLADQLIQ